MRLKSYKIPEFKTSKGVFYSNLEVSYQFFGQNSSDNPVVLINHALTGNSDIASLKNGWWRKLVGINSAIDLSHYSVIGIDILGNGYKPDNSNELEPEDFTLFDIGKINWLLLAELKISELYACVGGSIGGGVAWEMAIQKPNAIKYLIPIASGWRANDWIIGHNFIQSKILEQENGLGSARMMAMLFYRNPESLKSKFNNQTDKDWDFKINSWLNYHGETLAKRYKKSSYKMMNHLLATLDITRNRSEFGTLSSSLKCKVVQIGISTDLYFSNQENRHTHEVLTERKIDNDYHEIESVHGHDAFLIEYEQLTNILTPYFINSKQQLL